MKLKCIGGPNNGEWYDVPNHLRDKDHYSICIAPKLTLAFPIDNYIPETIIHITHEYVVHVLKGPRNEIFKYLTPYREDEWKCLTDQLKGCVIDLNIVDKLFKLRFNTTFKEWFEMHKDMVK